MKKIKTRQELIKLYLDFFKSKKHAIIPGASLVPENDPTVLFTTAGMHPLVPYLLGQKHPLGKRLTDVQKCVRTVDIEDVGDTTHHTFFEQLGNWSLGNYGKGEAIKMSFEFLIKELKFPIEKLAGSIFKGDKDAPKDTESYEALISIGIPKERIASLGKEDNWWGPAGKTGPCGPDSEIFYWISDKPVPKKLDPDNKNWVELGNNVFMEYNKDSKGNYSPLKQKSIDFGGGSERMLSILNKSHDNYLTHSFKPIIDEIEYLSNKKYDKNKKEMRIIADHIKAATFIISDGVIPSNTEQGYVLRRLIRRAIMNLRKLGFVGTDLVNPIAEKVFEIYKDDKQLQKNRKLIYDELQKEEERFDKTLEKGLTQFQKMSNDKLISGKEAFLLFQSYGFPIEMTQELAKEKKIKVDIKAFKKEASKHQQLSRTASAGKFKSGLADDSEKTKRLHTATHILNKALKTVLKDKNISQKGSNINPERLRFDFNFPRKLTADEIQKVEALVNKKINEALEVTKEEMPLKKAIASGATAEFGARYPDVVSVYTIKGFSKEICTGPHINNTKQIGTFKIAKEESSAAGVRRIKATVN